MRVSDLLDRVGVQPAASWVLWQADDGFTESLPIEVARHPDTWIAYLMGDQPLTPEHGFPARVLIPGRFGMKQPKWVRRMQLADHEEAGYWVQRGWDQEAVRAHDVAHRLAVEPGLGGGVGTVHGLRYRLRRRPRHRARRGQP